METTTPRRPVLRLARAVRLNWLERHQHWFNFAIHLMGIPLTILGVVLFFFVEWYWGAAAFILGYLFQWVGHLVEGNDIGEMIPIKKALGFNTVAIAAQYRVPPNA